MDLFQVTHTTHEVEDILLPLGSKDYRLLHLFERGSPIFRGPTVMFSSVINIGNYILVAQLNGLRSNSGQRVLQCSRGNATIKVYTSYAY